MQAVSVFDISIASSSNKLNKKFIIGIYIIHTYA